MNFSDIADILTNFRFRDVIDIIIIAYIIYWIMKLIKQTRAEQLLKGLVILIVSLNLSDWLGLRTTHFILQNTMTLGVIALLIVFQPELRRALERLGRGKLFSKFLFVPKEDYSDMIEEVARAAQMLAEKRFGALIVLEKEVGLRDFADTGIVVNSEVTAELLVTIFFPNSPLHDGAVIIRNGRLHAAGCFLPLSDNPNISKQLGTRHRAGLGATENGDCLVVVVSEETGIISIAEEGKLSRFLDIESVKERIRRSLEKDTVKNQFQFFTQGRDKKE